MSQAPDIAIQQVGGKSHDVDDEKKLSHESSSAEETTAGKVDITPLKKRLGQPSKIIKRIKKPSNPLKMPPSFAAGLPMDNCREIEIEQLRRERDEWKRKAEKLETDFEDIKKQGRKYFNMAKVAQNENERLEDTIDKLNTASGTFIAGRSSYLRFISEDED